MKSQKIATISVNILLLLLLAFLSIWYYPGIISLTVVGAMMDADMPNTITSTQTFLCIIENILYWLSALSTIVLSILLINTIFKTKDDVLTYVKKLKTYSTCNLVLTSIILLMNIIFGFVNDAALFFFLFMFVALLPSLLEMLLCLVLKRMTLKDERDGII